MYFILTASSRSTKPTKAKNEYVCIWSENLMGRRLTRTKPRRKSDIKLNLKEVRSEGELLKAGNSSIFTTFPEVPGNLSSNFYNISF